MTISKNLKKLFVAGAALLMVASTGTGVSNASAKRRYRYHYRTHRIYRRHARRHYKIRRHARKHARHQIRHVRKHARRRTYRARRYKSRVQYANVSAKGRHKSNNITAINHIKNPYLKKIAKIIHSWGYDTNDAIYRAKGMLTDNIDNIDDPIISNLVQKYQNKYVNNHLPKIAPQSSFIKQAEQDEVNDINQDRADVGESPLAVDPELQHLAEMRAPQLYAHMSHFDPNNNNMPYTDEDDPNATNNLAENIDESSDYTPKSLADGINKDLYYNEKPSAENPNGGGHYQNITNKDYTTVGVGFYKDGLCAEEFGNNEPDAPRSEWHPMSKAQIAQANNPNNISVPSYESKSEAEGILHGHYDTDLNV